MVERIPAPGAVGWVLALLVLVLVVVLAAVGQLDLKLAGLLGALAVSRLV